MKIEIKNKIQTPIKIHSPLKVGDKLRLAKELNLMINNNWEVYPAGIILKVEKLLNVDRHIYSFLFENEDNHGFGWVYPCSEFFELVEDELL